MEDFSLIILCKERKHLLSSTLDSLKDQKGFFEVILVSDEEVEYPGLNIRRCSATGSLAVKMNCAVKEARGAYVQFLEPGDRYLSPHGLEFLRGFLEKNPPFVLDQGCNGIPFFWMRKEKILELGGFDEKLKFCPLQDLLYRFERVGVSCLLCPRVLVDTTYQRNLSVKETWKSLRRNLGWKRAMQWLLVDNRTRVLLKMKKLVREAFLREQ